MNASARLPSPPARILALALSALAAAAHAAPAQAASPRTGDIALTPALAVYRAPGDDAYGEQVAPSVALDFHWTARHSLRGTLGLVQLPARSGSRQGSLTTVYATLNVSRNWFGTRWFPFVTGGLGVYAVDEEVARDGDGDGLELGLNGGGGLEARLSETWTLRVEALLHGLTGAGPSRVATASLGVKYYF